MIQNKDSARKIADFLLQIKAIKLQPDKPFTWSSGIKSPIYCDNRKTLSYPKIRTYLRQQFTSVIQETYGKPHVIAGTEKLIEGEIEEGESVVLIEDLISTGGSSLKAAEAMRKEGCLVKGIVSIFDYNLGIAAENFKKAKVNVTSLCDYNTLIQRALESNYITEKDLKPLEEWVKNPEGWKK